MTFQVTDPEGFFRISTKSVNKYVEKRGLDTLDAASRAGFNNLPIGKAMLFTLKIKGLRTLAGVPGKTREKFVHAACMCTTGPCPSTHHTGARRRAGSSSTRSITCGCTPFDFKYSTAGTMPDSLKVARPRVTMSRWPVFRLGSAKPARPRSTSSLCNGIMTRFSSVG